MAEAIVPRREIRELSPEEQAAQLAELRKRYRLRDKIKANIQQSKRRRREEHIMRDLVRQGNEHVDKEQARLAKLLIRNEQRRIRSIADLCRRERTIVIRRETRSMHLAYCFLRAQTAYDRMEFICYTQPDWARIEEIVREHMSGDERIIMQRFADWLGAAKSSNAFRPAKVRMPAQAIR